MNFALILAGGFGTRMGNTQKPKQFLNLGSKPILIHTIEKFSIFDDFEQVIVLTPKEWINYTKDLISDYDFSNVVVVEGGELRIDTVNKGMEYILENFEGNNHIIVTHDAVRPFVSHRIIKENIECAKKFGACDTVILATDTIVESKNNELITDIPIRDYMYQGQTPQSFRLDKLKSFYDNLDEDEKLKLSDACKLFVLNKEEVYLVEGDISNIKITHPYDLKVANFILREYND